MTEDRFIFIGDVQRKKYVMAWVKKNGKYIMIDPQHVEKFIQTSMESDNKKNMILFTEDSHDYKGITKYWTGE